MNLLADDISMDILGNWLSPKDTSKVTSLSKVEDKHITELMNSGNFINDTPIFFRKEILKSGMIFTKLKVVIVTGDLIEYIKFLGNKLEKIYLLSLEESDPNISLIFDIVPVEKIEYDYFVRFENDKVGNHRVMIDKVDNFEEMITDYLQNYGDKIIELYVTSSIFLNNLNLTMRLVEKYCINLKSLNCFRLLEDVEIPSLETIIGCETLNKFSKCVNVSKLIRCRGFLPRELVNLRTVYLCKIHIPKDIFVNLTEYVGGVLISAKHINVKHMKQLQISDAKREIPLDENFAKLLKRMPELKSIFIHSSKSGIAVKEFLRKNDITWLETFIISGDDTFLPTAHISLDILSKYSSLDELIQRKKFNECHEIARDFIMGRRKFTRDDGKVDYIVENVVENLPIDTIIDIAVKCNRIRSISFNRHYFTKRQIKRLLFSKGGFKLLCLLRGEELEDVLRMIRKYNINSNSFEFIVETKYKDLSLDLPKSVKVIYFDVNEI